MNHIFDIMSLLNTGMDLKTAILKSIPQRKIAEELNPEQIFKGYLKKGYKNSKYNSNRDHDFFKEPGRKIQNKGTFFERKLKHVEENNTEFF